MKSEYKSPLGPSPFSILALHNASAGALIHATLYVLYINIVKPLCFMFMRKACNTRYEMHTFQLHALALVMV